MVFGGFENVHGHALDFACFFIDRVEEVEEELEPDVDDVEFLLVERLLCGGFVGEGWDEEGFDGHEDFFPETRHDHYHGFVGKGRFHDVEIVVEVIEKRLEGLVDVRFGWHGCCGLGSVAVEVA